MEFRLRFAKSRSRGETNSRRIDALPISKLVGSLEVIYEGYQVVMAAVIL